MSLSLRKAALAAYPCATLATPAIADPAFKKLQPYLIDFAGWDGDKADGASIDMGDTKMTTASRSYHRGGDRLNISILIGAAAKGALGPVMSEMSLETADGYMKTTTFAGFKALRSFNSKERSGALLVALGEDEMLNFNYTGAGDDEAMAMAQKLDLKGIQAAGAAK